VAKGLLTWSPKYFSAQTLQNVSNTVGMTRIIPINKKNLLRAASYVHHLLLYCRLLSTSKDVSTVATVAQKGVVTAWSFSSQPPVLLTRLLNITGCTYFALAARMIRNGYFILMWLLPSSTTKKVSTRYCSIDRMISNGK
jgi:hypothetical protein